MGKVNNKREKKEEKNEITVNMGSGGWTEERE